MGLPGIPAPLRPTLRRSFTPNVGQAPDVAYYSYYYIYIYIYIFFEDARTAGRSYPQGPHLTVYRGCGPFPWMRFAVDEDPRNGGVMKIRRQYMTGRWRTPGKPTVVYEASHGDLYGFGNTVAEAKRELLHLFLVLNSNAEQGRCRYLHGYRRGRR